MAGTDRHWMGQPWREVVTPRLRQDRSRAFRGQHMGDDGVGVAMTHAVFGLQERHEHSVLRRKLIPHEPLPFVDGATVLLLDGREVRGWPLGGFDGHGWPSRSHADRRRDRHNALGLQLPGWSNELATSSVAGELVNMSDHAEPARVVGWNNLPHTGRGRHERMERIPLAPRSRCRT